MKKMILFAGLAAACSVPAQLVQTLVQPEPVVQPQPVVQQVVQPAVQQVTTTTVQPVQQVTTTTLQPVQQVTTTTVAPPAPPPVIVVPQGYQTCPRCGGRGKEEHALGFKVKRCKLCDGKGFLPPPPPPPPAPVYHRRHHHR